MGSPVARASERPLDAVPGAVKVVLIAALAAQMTWQALATAPIAEAAALERPAPVAWLRAMSFGEALAASGLMTLYLQAFDNQPGVSIPFAALDYEAVIAWLDAALALDPNSQYPVMMAAHLYAQVPDEKKQREMLDFVRRKFLEAPDRRWRWLAHAAIVAKHRLNDMPLALAYAEEITRHAPSALGWARQMRIFILEDMGEREAAAVLLGGLLDSGEVTDPREVHFLSQRLEALKAGEKSSAPSKSR
jgi:hypothetical protein